LFSLILTGGANVLIAGERVWIEVCDWKMNANIEWAKAEEQLSCAASLGRG
jgi:hypothetical protein